MAACLFELVFLSLWLCYVCSDGAGSVDSFDSDEELSVGEEGSLKIDWEGWLLHELYRVDL